MLVKPQMSCERQKCMVDMLGGGHAPGADSGDVVSAGMCVCVPRGWLQGRAAMTEAEEGAERANHQGQQGRKTVP